MQTHAVGTATATMICDSIHKGSRLSSIEVTFPRPFLAEFNTHCRFSRNSASSRAIPVWKRMLAVLEKPYVPTSFGVNKAGMQASEELSEDDKRKAVQNWLFGRDMAIMQAYALIGGEKELLSVATSAKAATAITKLIENVEKLIRDYDMRAYLSVQDKGLHKQHANRVLETYAFHTVIVTATHWRNFAGLRASTDAQPEACDFGLAILRALKDGTPRELQRGEWHLPYVRPEDLRETTDTALLSRASAGKCARTSHLTHDGIRSLEKDVQLASDLLGNGHMSPFQHPARPREENDPDGSNGNYSRVWTQLRKLIENEHDFTRLITREKLLAGCRGDEEMVDFILSLPE